MTYKDKASYDSIYCILRSEPTFENVFCCQRITNIV